MGLGAKIFWRSYFVLILGALVFGVLAPFYVEELGEYTGVDYLSLPTAIVGTTGVFWLCIF